MLLNGVQEVLKIYLCYKFSRYELWNIWIIWGATTNGVVCNLRFPTNIRLHSGKLCLLIITMDHFLNLILAQELVIGKSFSYPRNLAIHGNIMYASHRGGLYTHNLSTDTTVNCSTNVGSVGSSYSMTVDSPGSNLYFYTYRNLHRHQITGDCPSTSRTSRIYWKNLRYVIGMEAHPSDDSILYFTSFFGHNIKKVTMNAARTGYSTTSSVGRRGSNHQVLLKYICITLTI